MLAKQPDILPSRTALAFRLVMLLALMITGYFTVSENVALTRVVKVLLRLSTTVIIYMEYRRLSRIYIASFRHSNTLAFFFYLMYLLLGLSSLMWSTKPGYSLLQLLMTSQSLFFCYFFIKTILLYNAFNKDQELSLHCIFGQAIFLILLVFVAGRWIEPDSFFRLTHGGEEARLGGYFMNPNELGMLAVVALSMYMIDFHRRGFSLYNAFMFALVLYALIMTGSRSSMIGFLLIVLYFIKQSDNAKLKATIYLMVLVSIPFIVQMIFIKQGDLSEVLSMTGRLPFWKALITESLPREPYFGFGFMRIAYKDAFQGVHTYAGQMTHNTFIQVLLNLGFVGLFIACVQLFFTVRAAILATDNYRVKFFMGVFIPIIINSFTEFGIFGESNYGILFWQFLIFLFLIQYNPQLNRYQKVLFKIRGLNPALVSN